MHAHIHTHASMHAYTHTHTDTHTHTHRSNQIKQMDLHKKQKATSQVQSICASAASTFFFTQFYKRTAARENLHITDSKGVKIFIIHIKGINHKIHTPLVKIHMHKLKSQTKVKLIKLFLFVCYCCCCSFAFHLCNV